MLKMRVRGSGEGWYTVSDSIAATLQHVRLGGGRLFDVCTPGEVDSFDGSPGVQHREEHIDDPMLSPAHFLTTVAGLSHNEALDAIKVGRKQHTEVPMSPVSLGPPQPIEEIERDHRRDLRPLDAFTANTDTTPEVVRLMREGDTEAAEDVRRAAARTDGLTLYLEAMAAISGDARGSHYKAELARVLVLREEHGEAPDVMPSIEGVETVHDLALALARAEQPEQRYARKRFNLGPRHAIALSAAMTFAALICVSLDPNPITWVAFAITAGVTFYVVAMSASV